MTKRFLTALRYTVVAAMMASCFVLSGCKDDDKGPSTFSGTIVEFLKQDQFKQAKNNDADQSFDSLVMYFDKYPDLEALLSGSSDYTLFAPNNSAFVSLTALPGLKDPDQINPDIIKGVLAYHIVSGKKMQADLTAGAKIATIYTDPTSNAVQNITVNNDGTLLTGSLTTSIKITAADQLTTNGVVHTVGTVLIPPATGGQLSAILGSLGASVLLGKDFTYMAYMIGYADSGVTDPTMTYTGILAKGTDLTLLAIPNEVFIAMTGKASPSDTEVKTAIATAFPSPTAARAILNNHLIAGKYVVTGATGTTHAFSAGTLASMGKTLLVQTNVPTGTCHCPTGVVLATSETSVAPIVQADISTQAGISNGILQVVGGILQ